MDFRRLPSASSLIPIRWLRAWSISPIHPPWTEQISTSPFRLMTVVVLEAFSLSGIRIMTPLHSRALLVALIFMKQHFRLILFYSLVIQPTGLERRETDLMRTKHSFLGLVTDWSLFSRVLDSS